ncbi:MAG: hypothetical protein JST87_13935 [Bacteroidetes bacterium]|nr:hypothetical protein [Bacteroidota bacterium]
MKSGIVIVLMLAICSWAKPKNAEQSFDKSFFYNVLASEDLSKINAQLQAVQKASFPEKQAFEGTLLMKKAAIVPTPGQKLNLFKSGHKKLEASINLDTKNAEFRFLRLVIQENAPKFLNYHNNITEDAAFVRNAYKTLPNVVQNAIKNYSKKSKVLHTQDL